MFTLWPRTRNISSHDSAAKRQTRTQPPHHHHQPASSSAPSIQRHHHHQHTVPYDHSEINRTHTHTQTHTKCRDPLVIYYRRAAHAVWPLAHCSRASAANNMLRDGSDPNIVRHAGRYICWICINELVLQPTIVHRYGTWSTGGILRLMVYINGWSGDSSALFAR